MPNQRQRQRELARRRYVRQQARREQARRRRQRMTALVAGVVVLLAGVGVVLGFAFSGGKSNTNASTNPTPSASTSATPTTSPSASTSPTAAATPSVLACYQKAPPAAPAGTQYAKAPDVTVDTAATYTMKIDTTCGIITAALDVKDAPTTVNSFVFLASQKFFDGDECHRTVTEASLTVLQCGDPTATGSGGPGYSFKDENLTGAKYTRGTLAMANSGANTNGSQFFLVDKDSDLPASYTVFGHITSGLDVLDKIIAKGVYGGGTDGRPGQRVFIKSMTITETKGGKTFAPTPPPNPGTAGASASATPSTEAKASATATASATAKASASASTK